MQIIPFNRRVFLLCLTGLLFLSAGQSIAQVGIGTTTPDATAVLDLQSGDKGILLPRVDLSQNPIPGAAKSLLLWNTDSAAGEGFWFYNGNSWEELRQTKKLNIASLSIPSGNGVQLHNLDLGLTTANVNADLFRLNGATQQFTITGIAGGTSGRVLRIYHTGSGNMIFSKENSNSQPENRFLSLNNSDVHTNGTGIVTIYYDDIVQRWVILNAEQ